MAALGGAQAPAGGAKALARGGRAPVRTLPALAPAVPAPVPAAPAYTLLGADRRPYRSAAPGQLGGHRRSRIYGRLDCPSARRAIARGGYIAHRVFFADEPAAIAAGYRPCAVCLPSAYAAWLASTTPRPPRHGSAPLPQRRGAK